MSKKLKKKVVNAPYVEPDSKQLGDTYISPQENIYREREKCLKQASKAKLWKQEELEDTDRSLGPRLHYSEIIRRLQRLNPRLLVKDGTEGSIALYRPKRGDEYDLETYDRERPDWYWHHVYVTGMEKGWLPEWGHVLLDTSHLATREIRGWRSVLIALIKSKAISYNDAVKEFGDPIGDQRSMLWYDQLQKHMPILGRRK